MQEKGRVSTVKVFSKSKKIIASTGIALLLFAFDQAIKAFVRASIQKNESLEIFPGVLWLTYVENTGVAFGIGKGLSIYLSVFGFLALLGILIVFKKAIIEDTSGLIGICLLIAGAVGNLFDRILMGAVTDFIDLGIWPVFNIADLYITIGILLLLPTFLREAIQKREKEISR